MGKSKKQKRDAAKAIELAAAETDAERVAIEDKFRLAKLQTKWHKSTEHNPENLGLFAYNRAKYAKRNPVVASSDIVHIIQNGVEKKVEYAAAAASRSLLVGLTTADVCEPTKTYNSSSCTSTIAAIASTSADKPPKLAKLGSLHRICTASEHERSYATSQRFKHPKRTSSPC